MLYLFTLTAKHLRHLIFQHLCCSSLVQESRTECVKNSEESEIFTFLTNQQVRLAMVLWMLAEHMRILGQRQRTLLIAVARGSAFSYTSSLSPNSYRVTLNKIWPMYRFYFHEIQSRKTFLWLKEILQSWWLECWGQSEYRFCLQISILLGMYQGSLKFLWMFSIKFSLFLNF